MTKSPAIKKEESNPASNATSLSLSPAKNKGDLSEKTEELKTYRTIDRVEAPPARRKLTKVAQFPEEFNDIQGML